MTLTKWEYMELTVPVTERNVQLNLLGEKGWECYEIKHFWTVAPGEDAECTLYLKRPKEEILLEGQS